MELCMALSKSIFKSIIIFKLLPKPPHFASTMSDSSEPPEPPPDLQENQNTGNQNPLDCDWDIRDYEDPNDGNDSRFTDDDESDIEEADADNCDKSCSIGKMTAEDPTELIEVLLARGSSFRDVLVEGATPLLSCCYLFDEELAIKVGLGGLRAWCGCVWRPKTLAHSSSRREEHSTIAFVSMDSVL